MNTTSPPPTFETDTAPTTGRLGAGGAEVVVVLVVVVEVVVVVLVVEVVLVVVEEDVVDDPPVTVVVVTGTWVRTVVGVDRGAVVTAPDDEVDVEVGTADPGGEGGTGALLATSVVVVPTSTTRVDDTGDARVGDGASGRVGEVSASVVPSP